jgi:2-polyprenyl-3-methyl-5-hydroxy-6-metoxy-1,4-benzoquinol methylase
MNSSENFRDKYINAGRIGGMLVDRFYDAVRDLLKMRATEVNSVLEIGVGEGFSTRRIREMVPPEARFEASEFRHDLARLARERNPGVRICQESVYALARETGSHDLVLCLEVLEHLERPQEALKELARVSRRYAIVSVPREPIWRVLNLVRGKYIGALGNTPGHLQHWSTQGFRHFVEPVFHVLAVRTPLPWSVFLLQIRD